MERLSRPGKVSNPFFGYRALLSPPRADDMVSPFFLVQGRFDFPESERWPVSAAGCQELCSFRSGFISYFLFFGDLMRNYSCFCRAASLLLYAGSFALGYERHPSLSLINKVGEIDFLLPFSGLSPPSRDHPSLSCLPSSFNTISPSQALSCIFLEPGQEVFY